MRWFKY